MLCVVLTNEDRLLPEYDDYSALPHFPGQERQM